MIGWAVIRRVVSALSRFGPASFRPDVNRVG